MNRTQRDAAVDGLQYDDSVKVMLMSLKAGGIGLVRWHPTSCSLLDLLMSRRIEPRPSEQRHLSRLRLVGGRRVSGVR